MTPETSNSHKVDPRHLTTVKAIAPQSSLQQTQTQLKKCVIGRTLVTSVLLPRSRSYLKTLITQICTHLSPKISQRLLPAACGLEERRARTSSLRSLRSWTRETHLRVDLSILLDSIERGNLLMFRISHSWTTSMITRWRKISLSSYKARRERTHFQHSKKGEVQWQIEIKII
jgi:hypothetical protein